MDACVAGFPGILFYSSKIAKVFGIAHILYYHEESG